MVRTRDLARELAGHGLIPRGGFNFADGEDAPPGPSGAPAQAVLLVGQAGAAPWLHFLKWREAQPPGLENPLDTWSREVIGAVAGRFGARAVFPSERPYLPFQQWAMRAEKLRPSPLGILMHPEYGLWHAYRGALLFDHELDLPDPGAPAHLCDACAEKPCLASCPVDAHSAAGFDHAGCLEYVRSAKGRACASRGCLDRNACPHGAAYRYPAEMQAFHMRAFTGN
ncbi:hypothetical protein C7I84_11855 [Mesorhizobium ephedrae]|uniref:4Fe-4S ferredoxin-type domain-containing protein n=1 Tax=Kumtagia ephedrae TaxID=2116701 RepID=A0A2P7SC83_9HYPH|nr:hypothetical protein C7I84_11855 [Mesorhizobium ephedrae]